MLEYLDFCSFRTVSKTIEVIKQTATYLSRRFTNLSQSIHVRIFANSLFKTVDKIRALFLNFFSKSKRPDFSPAFSLKPGIITPIKGSKPSLFFLSIKNLSKEKGHYSLSHDLCNRAINRARLDPDICHRLHYFNNADELDLSITRQSPPIPIQALEAIFENCPNLKKIKIPFPMTPWVISQPDLYLNEIEALKWILNKSSNRPHLSISFVPRMLPLLPPSQIALMYGPLGLGQLNEKEWIQLYKMIRNDNFSLNQFWNAFNSCYTSTYRDGFYFNFADEKILKTLMKQVTPEELVYCVSVTQSFNYRYIYNFISFEQWKLLVQHLAQNNEWDQLFQIIQYVSIFASRSQKFDKIFKHLVNISLEQIPQRNEQDQLKEQLTVSQWEALNRFRAMISKT